MSQFVYCLNASTIKTTPILEQIRVAATAGYQAIELWHDDIDAHIAGGGQVADVCHALQDHGLQVPTTIFLKGWWDTVGPVYDSALDETRRRLSQSQTLGASFAIAGPPLGPVDFQVGAQNYARLLEVGREFGVKPVVQHLERVEQVVQHCESYPGCPGTRKAQEYRVQNIARAGNLDCERVHSSPRCCKAGTAT